MVIEERETPQPGQGEVLIRVRACSINYRDQLMARGAYAGGGSTINLNPLSCGAGEVAAVGQGVTDFAAGDYVAGTFFLSWEDGPANPGQGAALGGPGAPGMLAEYVVLPQSAVVKTATTLTLEQAATLPCAGVTAWNALMEGPRATAPDDVVLVLGTGGVSVLALQIAHAVGAKVIATSSSDEKLARMKALGADEIINYRDTSQWGAIAAKLSGKSGVDRVIEVGGTGTLPQSFQAVGFAGEVSLIGVLDMTGDSGPHGLMFKGASMRGIYVGSRGMARRLNAFVDAHRIKPVIGRSFAFEQAKDAFDYVASPDLFAKAIITL
jgi:NADPH:quinone reductase-like Zn-dependent oxidoreductase